MIASPKRLAPPPLSEAAFSEVDFPSLRLTRSSRRARSMAKWLLIAIAVAIVAMVFAPWQQSVRGDGTVVAFDPVNRTQDVQSPVKGVIDEIGDGIFENAEVKRGQLVYRIVDQDPQYLTRINQQIENTRQQIVNAEQRLERTQDHLAASRMVVEAKQDELKSTRAGQIEAMAAADAYVLMAENKLAAERAGVVAAEGEVWQTELDYNRKKDLNEKGFESGRAFQEAELKYRQAMAKLRQAEEYVGAAQNEVEAKKKDRESKRQEWEGKINSVDGELAKSQSEVAKSQSDVAKTKEEIGKINNDLTKLETQYARQETQEVRAPRDGYIMRLLAYDRSAIVKQGDILFTIVPQTDKPAVQLWVDGNDAPLIAPGRHVRLQFEGWPAAQFSGWPSVAVGTFGGEVAIVDPTDDGMGKFRVVVTPDDNSDPWPEYPYLRQGVRAKGWVLLNRVPLGYEVWRRMNGFPPSLKSVDDADKGTQPKPPKVKV